MPEKPDPAKLLAWYDRHRRIMPWRARPGEAADPYRVWLSEIMLQQTTVAAVIPYYERFLARFPDVHALAAAESDSVMSAWAGLGYYARARNLHACAKAVSAAGGVFPSSVEGLLALPGIGPYTARAVAAIAFGVPVVPVDGNVERVTARLHAIETPMPAAKPQISEAAARFGEHRAAQARASDFAQALFDLGATICTGTPACAICPLTENCAGRIAGIAADLPVRAPKKARPLRHGALFWLTDSAGKVLLRRRPARGLLGGMTELPGTEWRAAPWAQADALALGPMAASWRPAGRVRHVFTHFELWLDVFAARVGTIAAEGFLRDVDALEAEALPSVMRKAVVLGEGCVIQLYALVAVGGAIGSVGRFWLAGAVARLTGPAFPWGTVLINILGSLLIGWLAGVTVYGRVQNAESLRAFAMAGLCGGFTTFSSFSLQTMDLLRGGHPWGAAANVVFSVVLCVTATGFGLWLARV